MKSDHASLSQVFKLLQLFLNSFDVGIEIMVAALIYTDRLLTLNKEWLVIDENNCKGFLHSALTLAAKFYLDKFERNTIFHILLGIPSPVLGTKPNGKKPINE